MIAEVFKKILRKIRMHRETDVLSNMYSRTEKTERKEMKNALRRICPIEMKFRIQGHLVRTCK